MKRLLMPCLVAGIMVLFSAVCFAGKLYPDTLEDNSLVLVDGHMGSGMYADLSSVVVQEYAPPEYQIAVNIVNIRFSGEYFQSYRTYLNGPYTIGDVWTMYFRYHWDTKTVSVYNDRMEAWQEWDIHREHCHADGDPLIPQAAESAFIAAYHMKFYGDIQGYSPSLKRSYRVISEEFYRCFPNALLP